MDAIIYLILDKGNHTGGQEAGPPVFTIRQLDRAYRLMLVKVPAGIFEERGPAGGARRGSVPAGGARSGSELPGGDPAGGAGFLEYFRARLAARRDRQARLAEEERLRRVVEGLFETLSPYLQGCSARYTVYDDSMLPKRLPDCSGAVWHRLWRLPPVTDFREEMFARELLEQCFLPHILVLGCDRSVPELLWGRLRRVKSLRFLVERLPEGLEDFLDEADEEYGLAATAQVLPGARGEKAGAFFGARPVCPAPALVLDYSGEEHILTDRVAAGSVWLDMDSLEEKRRRIEERNTGILYFSMKKLWKQAGMLDTPCKNRYNT